MLSSACKNRLENWKFTSALRYAERGSRATSAEYETISALSLVFGNSGGFGGTIGAIVAAAVARLLDGYEADDEPDPVFAEEWKRRLRHWEFASAWQHLIEGGSSKNVAQTVEALAHGFGDTADFDGLLTPIVNAAVDRLLDDWPDTATEGGTP
jgi:hypothetical protein